MRTGLRRTRRKPLVELGPTRFGLTQPRLRSRSRTVAPPLLITTEATRKELAWKDSGFSEASPAESSRGDTLQLYLREIGQVKLLTPKEEIELARRIRCGDKLAREQMIKANLRLVCDRLRASRQRSLVAFFSASTQCLKPRQHVPFHLRQVGCPASPLSLAFSSRPAPGSAGCVRG